MEPCRSGRPCVRCAWLMAWLTVLLRAMLLHDAAVATRPGRGSGNAAGSGLYLDLRDIVNCPAKTTSVSNFNFSSIYEEKKRAMMFTGYFDVDRPAQSFLRFSFTFHTCKGGVSASSCEYHAAWAFKNNVCTEIASPITFWTSVIRSITPPFGCPAKKGRYLVTNSSTDLTMIAQMAAKEANADITWLVTFEIIDEQKRPFACVKLTLRLVPLSKRKDKAGRHVAKPSGV